MQSENRDTQAKAVELEQAMDSLRAELESSQSRELESQKKLAALKKSNTAITEVGVISLIFFLPFLSLPSLYLFFPFSVLLLLSSLRPCASFIAQSACYRAG